MSRDVHLVDKSGEDATVWSLDNLATQKWLEGHAPGAEYAAAYLTDRASKVFLDGDTKKAEIYRDMAKEILAKLLPELRAKAKKHAEDYPSEVEPDDG